MEKAIDLGYAKLQNGSDVRGIAMKGVPGEDVNLTSERVHYIAKAFAQMVAKIVNKPASELRIAIGHDSRLTAQALTKAAIEGMTEVGVSVSYCGIASTPSMFMATVLDGLKFDGAVMLTASHLPFNRNGMKFFTAQGGFEKEQIKELLVIAQDLAAAALLAETKGTETAERTGTWTPFDLMTHYSNHLKKVIKREVNAEDYEHPLKGLHIVVDASNGVGGFFPGSVLEPLGADVSGSICLDPDGTFPNHVPNPEDKEAMEAIRSATLGAGADLGVIFDTDGDRGAVVFSNGKEVNRNAIIAMMAAIVAKDHPGSTVVTDSVTSDELADFIENDLGLTHHRFKRGYKNVINESIRLNAEGIDSQLAIETSGHGAMKENYFLDDGAYLSVKIIIEAARCLAQGKKLEDMISALKEPEDAAEYRLKIKADEFKSYGENVLEQFMEFCSWQEKFHIVPNNYEGIRVSFDDEEVKGWLLLRMSLHDPIMPLNVEAKEAGGVAIIVNRIKEFMAQFEELDSSSLG